MLESGLTSITFRKLSPADIVKLTAQAELDAIEWGGDVHVPPNNVDNAGEIARMTRDAGVEVSSYGSYYRVHEEEKIPFTAILETAGSLGTDTIRIWAGRKNAEDADQAYWDAVVNKSREFGDIARKAGMTLAFEYHNNTLANSAESTVRLLNDINHENVKTYWQVKPERTPEENAHDLQLVLPALVNVHAFHWAAGNKRLPLEEGTNVWSRYIELLQNTGKEHCLLLEFVLEDQPDAFKKDAAALKQWLA